MGAMAVAIGYALKAQPLLPLPDPLFPLPISIFRIQSPFSPLPVSGRVTSGTKTAFHASLWHFPILPYISSLVNL